MINTKRVDLTEGPILKRILLFILPLLATSALQQLFNTADMVIVRWFVGDKAYAAVASTGTLVSLFIEFSLGFSIGANVVISRFIGEKNKEKTGKAVHTSILLALIGGAVIAIIGVLFTEPMLRMTLVPDELMAEAALYLRIYFAGIPVYLLYNFTAAVFRSIGKNRIPLFCLAVGGALNVLLNLLFTIGLSRGVDGVALATVISNLVSFAMLLAVLRHESEDIRFSFRKCKVDLAILRNILRIGLPSGFLGSVFSISNICIQTSVNSLGIEMITASSSAANIEIYVQYLGNAFAQACTTFIGQNYGAKRWDRCKRIVYTALPVCIGLTFLVSGVIYVFASEILKIFTVDPFIIELAKQRMKYTLLFKFVQCVMDIMVGVLQGYGRTVFTAGVSLVGVCGVRLIWIFTVFAANKTVDALFIIYPITWFIASVVDFIYYFRVFKKMRNTNEERNFEGETV